MEASMGRRRVAIGYSLFCLLMGSAHAAGCKGASCDGKDPVAMGCSSTAVTAKSVKYSGPYDDLFVDLRWSAICGTNWTRIRWENRFAAGSPPPNASTLWVIRTTIDPSTKTKVINGDGIFYTAMLNGTGGRCVKGKGIGTVFGQVAKTPSSTHWVPITVSLETQCM